MIDEIAGINPNNKIEWVCREIKRKYHGHKSGMFIYGDATSQKDDVKQEKGHDLFKLVMQHLSDFKPSKRVLSSNPSVTMRGNWINTILENNLGGISVAIDENCTK